MISAVKTESRHTPATSNAETQAESLDLSSALQFDERQMPAACQVSHGERELLTASPSHGSARPSTWRAAWPLSSWLESRCTAGGQEIEVDLVRSSSLERTVRPIAVVPLDEQRELTPESPPAIGNDELARALVLDGPDESLDNRETAIFLDGPEALSDATAAAPAPEAVIRELPVP